MTRAEWNSNPQLAKSLAEKLTDPLIQTALEIWEQESPSRIHADANALVITNTGVALAGQMTGYEKAIKNLKSLARYAEPMPQQIEETYGTDPTRPTE